MGCLLVYESPTKKLFCRLHVCKDTFAIFTIFFRKTFAFPPFVLMSIFLGKKREIYTIVVIFIGVSFLLSAQLLSNIKVLKKGLDMELIRLLGNYELEVKNVLLVPFAIASFFFTAILSSLFVPLRVWNCSVKTHRSMKFIWHWSRPFSLHSFQLLLRTKRRIEKWAFCTD